MGFSVEGGDLTDEPVESAFRQNDGDCEISLAFAAHRGGSLPCFAPQNFVVPPLCEIGVRSEIAQNEKRRIPAGAPETALLNSAILQTSARLFSYAVFHKATKRGNFSLDFP